MLLAVVASRVLHHFYRTTMLVNSHEIWHNTMPRLTDFTCGTSLQRNALSRYVEDMCHSSCMCNLLDNGNHQSQLPPILSFNGEVWSKLFPNPYHSQGKFAWSGLTNSVIAWVRASTKFGATFFFPLIMSSSHPKGKILSKQTKPYICTIK